VVLPIPKVAVPVKCSYYRPISLLACLSKVFEVLMARQMEAHVQRNDFQSGFRHHHSTTAAVTEDIRSNMEDGQVTVLVLLDFSQTFDMVIHELLLCKLKNLQNYLDVGGLVFEW
jgi:hypothetical protein